MLPPELLFIIFGIAVEEDPKSIGTISLVSKYFNDLMINVHAVLPSIKNNKIIRQDDFVKQIYFAINKYRYIKGIANIVTYGMKFTPLYISVGEKNYQMVNYFLEKGSDPCFKTIGIGTTLIKKLVEVKAPIEICENVLRKIDKISNKENHLDSATFGLSYTALHEAARRGYLEHVLLLLRFGADKSLMNKLGKTPLDIAIDEGHTEIIRVLQ